MESKHQIVVDMNNPYLKDMFNAFYQFLIEEVTGCVYSELRLQKQLQAIKRSYPEHRKALRAQSYFGDFNASNTELIFISR